MKTENFRDNAFHSLFSEPLLTCYMPSFYYVLSGGSAKGFAHVGIIRYLEEIGIYPKGIIGTSMGSLIGALYAFFMDTKKLEDYIGTIVTSKTYSSFAEKYLNQLGNSKLSLFASKLKTSLYFTRALFSSFVSYSDMAELFAGVFKNIFFSRLTTSYACVATDIINGKSDVLYSGSLCESVMASCSIPFIFPVIKYNHTLYTDGGSLANLPIKQAHRFFTDPNGFYIGSDASSPIQKIDNSDINNFDLAQRLMTLSIQSKMQEEKAACDFVFTPVTEYSKWSLFDNYKQFITTGYEYAKINGTMLFNSISMKIKDTVRQEKHMLKRFTALSLLQKYLV